MTSTVAVQASRPQALLRLRTLFRRALFRQPALLQALVLTLLLIVYPAAAKTTTAAAVTTKPASRLKLIVLAPDLVELLYSLGAGEQIIAASEHADYPEAARALPRVGNYAGLSLEKIISLQPDLVLYWQSGTPAADIERLQQLGLKLESFESKTLDDIALHLLRLGELTGRQQQAAQLAGQFHAELQALKTKYSQQQQLAVFYEIWDNPLSSIGPSAWPAQHLAICGARNVLPDGPNPYPQVSAEQVLNANPWLIIQPVSENEPRTLFNWQAFSSVKAVEYQQFAKPNSDLLHRASLRTLGGVRELCQLIEKSRQFYAQVLPGAGR